MSHYQPVAWMVYTQDGQSCYVTDNPADVLPNQRALPLYTEPFPTATHPAITHCDTCGCDWLDNGLNPIGCPYCKQSEAVDEAMVERIAALLYEEATDELWIVAGIEHPGPDRDYYRGLASKVVALVDPTRFMQRVRRDEALLRQALEALEFFRDTAICEADTAVATEAIVALSAALAAPTCKQPLQVAEQQGPEHIDSPDCWCHPELVYKDPENGAEVWVHKELQ